MDIRIFILTDLFTKTKNCSNLIYYFESSFQKITIETSYFKQHLIYITSLNKKHEFHKIFELSYNNYFSSFHICKKKIYAHLEQY